MKNPHKVPTFGKYTKSLKSIKRKDALGRLYYMEYSANYYPLMKLLDFVTRSGCTTFVTKNLEGETVMGRNFDLRHFRNNKETTNGEITSLIVVLKSSCRKAKYKSLAVADGFWLDSKKGTFYEGVLDDGKKDISMALFMPFICMDGINEAGLAVSIMHLPTKTRWDERAYISFDELTDEQKKKAVVLENSGEVPDEYLLKAKTGTIAINSKDRKAWDAYKKFAVNQKDEGKKSMLHPVLMRLMLDSCASVDEAIELAKSVNIKSVAPDADYHVMVADKTGRSVILEWIDNKLTFRDINHASNFYVCRDDHFGYGKERDALAASAIARYKNGMSDESVKNTLALASQNCIEGSDVGFTMWSGIYNLEKKTLKLYIHLDYGRCYEFKL